MASVKQIQIDSSTYDIAINEAYSGQGYGKCETAAATAAKVVTLSNYELNTGGIIAVKFTYDVPASATLNVNSKGAKNIRYKNANIIKGIINAGETATFMYDGSYYHLLSTDRERFVTTLVPYGTPITATSSAPVDLNTTNYLKVGNYFCSANDNAKYVSNHPTTVSADRKAFMMQVYAPLSTTVDDENKTWIYRLRRLMIYTGNEYIQYCYSNGTAGNWIYGPWVKAAYAGTATDGPSSNVTGAASSANTGGAAPATGGPSSNVTGAASSSNTGGAAPATGGPSSNVTGAASSANTGTGGPTATGGPSSNATGAASSSNTGNGGPTATGKSSGNTGAASGTTTLSHITGSFSNGILTLTSNSTTIVTTTHVHSLNSHTHSIETHSHSMSHTHSLSSHTHSIATHSHSMSHTHDLSSHTHTVTEHSHSMSHTHDLSSHTHTQK